MDRELKLRIVVEKPPAGVDFGLQKGHGSAYETVQTQHSTPSDMTFEFTVGIKGEGKSLTLTGPFVRRRRRPLLRYGQAILRMEKKAIVGRYRLASAGPVFAATFSPLSPLTYFCTPR